MEATYWNGIGKYQDQYEQLVNDLVPAMGKSDTVAGELIRSVSRLGYDFYNNGMGNNTSGAANFLLEKGAIDDVTHSTIYDFTRGRVYNGNYHGDHLQVAIERAVDMTVEFILNNPQLITMENSDDMFDYQDDDQQFCEECGDEVDTRCGWLCSYCEEAHEEQYDDEEEEWA